MSLGLERASPSLSREGSHQTAGGKVPVLSWSPSGLGPEAGGEAADARTREDGGAASPRAAARAAPRRPRGGRRRGRGFESLASVGGGVCRELSAGGRGRTAPRLERGAWPRLRGVAQAAGGVARPDLGGGRGPARRAAALDLRAPESGVTAA